MHWHVISFTPVLNDPPDEIVFHSVHHAPVECPCGVTAFHLACQHLVKEPKQKWCFGHQQAQELPVKLCYWISRASCAPAQTAAVVDVSQRSRERTNWRTKREVGGGGRKKRQTAGLRVRCSRTGDETDLGKGEPLKPWHMIIFSPKMFIKGRTDNISSNDISTLILRRRIHWLL